MGVGRLASSSLDREVQVCELAKVERGGGQGGEEGELAVDLGIWNGVFELSNEAGDVRFVDQAADDAIRSSAPLEVWRGRQAFARPDRVGVPEDRLAGAVELSIRSLQGEDVGRAFFLGGREERRDEGDELVGEVAERSRPGEREG